jgi:muramoyltetrapeptide carboxypeptidase LdcA involved in peptidoglycan recycling
LNLAQTDSLTCRTFEFLEQTEGEAFTQHYSKSYQIHEHSYVDNPDAVFNLTEPTRWRTLGNQNNLEMSGRLIGGCLDTLCHLFGTEFLDLQSLYGRYKPDGLILYLENAELSPTSLVRTLLSMKYKGVFKVLNGLLIGRNAASSDHGKSISHEEALKQVLWDLDIPIIYDVDIGHLPPNMTLINGARAKIKLEQEFGKVTQVLDS